MQQIKFYSNENYKSTGYIWDNVNNPKAVLFFVYNIWENVNFYNEFAKYLNENNIIFCACDLRMHGKTIEDNKKHLNDDYFKDNIYDQFTFYKIVQEKFNLPIIMAGHGFGCNIVVRLLEIYDLCNIAILSGAGYELSYKAKIAKRLSNITNFLNRKNTKHKIENIITYHLKKGKKQLNYISSNENFYHKYLNNLKNLKHIHDQYYASFLNNVVVNDKNINNINKKTRFLFIYGKNDCVSNNGKNLQKLYFKYTDLGYNANIKGFDDMLHNILNETNNKAVFKYVVSYINKYL